METHSHIRAGPSLGDMSACGESCRAWHGSRNRTLAGVCSGRKVVAALWPPASTCLGTSCWAGQSDALKSCAVLSLPCSQERSSRLCRLPTGLLRVWQRPVRAPPAESCGGALMLGNGWGDVALAALGTQAVLRG